MSDDTFDPHSGLFDSSDPPVDGAFDPFVPRFRPQGNEAPTPHGDSDRHDGDSDEETIDDDGVGIVRYGRFGGEGYGEHEQNDDGPLPWQGAGDIGVLGDKERRAREGADTGTRNVRRTAEVHAGGTVERGTGNRPTPHSPRLDSSISAATQRITAELRADLGVPLDARQRSDAVKNWQEGDKNNRKLKRTYQKTGILHSPNFLNTTFEAMVIALKANASGEWLLTLKIDPNAAQQVFPLHSAFGLALDVKIDRHTYIPDEE